jgi:peptidoglycan/xylan/chitin deacetylase (PgdA/CDA1 family)
LAGVRARLILLALGAAICLSACGGSSHSSAGATTQAPSGRTKAAGHRKARRPIPTPALIPPANPPQRSVTVPVLTYHRVHTMPAVGLPDLIVDPSTFAAELQALQAGGYHTIHQWQLFDALYKGAPLPPKPVIISVDDGYVDDVRTILPDLERFHMVATFFVITGRTSEPGFLSAEQIRELDRAGMDVGDHTAHHLDLPQLNSSEQQTEIAGSRQALQAILGHPVYYFAYPFGAYNSTVESEVRAAGFTMAYTTAGGTTESTATPLTWPRIHVGRDETASGLVSLLGTA